MGTAVDSKTNQFVDIVKKLARAKDGAANGITAGSESHRIDVTFEDRFAFAAQTVAASVVGHGALDFDSFGGNPRKTDHDMIHPALGTHREANAHRFAELKNRG